jgi:Family of unknown function (DUF6516)
MNPFQSLRDYERFIYTLQQRFPSIERSTLVVARRGSMIAIVRGELGFKNGYRITVSERLVLDTGIAVIDFYGYELWRHSTKFAWYDSQSHPDDPSLQSTLPHHKHIQPNIKHNRVPAPNMRFDKPNFPALIQEIETLIEKNIEVD